MSDPTHQPAAERPRSPWSGATLAGALLTWIAGGFGILAGLTLLIATSTNATALAEAITDTAGLGSTTTAVAPAAAVIVLIGLGLIPSALAVLTAIGSRVGLAVLTVAAAAYLLLVLVAFGNDHASLVMLFGVLWVGTATAMFWLGRRRQPSEHSGAPAGRPWTVAAGAVLVWLAGTLVVVFGAKVAWEGLATLLEDPNPALAGLGLQLGIGVAAVGVMVLTLATTTFLGSLDSLAALSMLCLLLLLVLLSPLVSGGSALGTAATTVVPLVWLGLAGGLLWSRSGQAFYRGRGR